MQYLMLTTLLLSSSEICKLVRLHPYFETIIEGPQQSLKYILWRYITLTCIHAHQADGSIKLKLQGTKSCTLLNDS